MLKRSKLFSWLLCLIFFFVQFAVPFNLIPLFNGNVYAATNSLQVQFFNNNKGGASIVAYPQFKITNTGTNAINFSDIKLRYYYTIDGASPQVFYCDWSTLSISNIIGKFVKMPNPQSDADYYLEIGFNSSNSFEAGSSIVIQTRFNKTNNTGYNQNNDYSFNNYASNYVDWTKVTAHIGSTLVWGSIPGGSSNIVSTTVPSYTNTPTATPTPMPYSQVTARSAFSKIEAESYNILGSTTMQKIDLGNNQYGMGYIYPTNYMLYQKIDFGSGAVSFKIRAAFNYQAIGYIDIKLNGQDGTKIGTVAIGPTGNWNVYQDSQCNISNITGIHDICLVFTGYMDVDWFTFSTTVAPTPTPTKTPTPTNTPTITPTTTSTSTPTYTSNNTPTTAPSNSSTPTKAPTPTPTKTLAPTSTPTVTATSTPIPTPTPTATVQASPNNAFSRLEAENYSSSNVTSIQKISTINGGSGVGYINSGNYLVFRNVNFGSNAASFKAFVANGNTTTTNIDIKLNSTSGTIVGTLSISPTGGWNTYVEKTCNTTISSGTYDLYLVFSGSVNIDWFMFYPGSTAAPTYTPTATRLNTPTNAPANTPVSTPANTSTNTPTSAPTSTSTPTKIALPTPTMQNIALNKMAISDSQYYNYNTGYSYYPTYMNNPINPFSPNLGYNDNPNPAPNNFFANYAVDGNTSTRWCAANDDVGHYLQIDLGGFYNIAGTEVNWKKNAGTVNKYKIDVSSNTIQWVMKVDRFNNTESDDIQTDNFLANGVRYVRITVTGLEGSSWASINEFKIFNNSNVKPPPAPIPPIPKGATPPPAPIPKETITPTPIQTNTPSVSNSSQTPKPTSTIASASATATSTATASATATPTATATPAPTGTSGDIVLPSPEPPDSVVANLAPVVPEDINLLNVSRIAPATALPTLKPFDTQSLDYSLASNVQIQAQKKNKEIILALDTSASMGTTNNSTSLDPRIFDYTLFSGLVDPNADNMLFSATKFSVTGKVHSNGKIGIYGASNEFTIDGNIEAVNHIYAGYQKFLNGTISASTLSLEGCTFTNATKNPGATVPVIAGMAPLPADTIKSQAQGNGGYLSTSSITISGQTLNLNSPIYTEGDLTISANSYSGNGLIAAKGAVTLSGTGVTQNSGGALCIYSAYDSTVGGRDAVSINCDSGAFYGLIYAPNGTVNLSGSNFTIYGRIIAKKINISSYNTKIIDQAYSSLTDGIQDMFINRLDDEKDAAKAFIDRFAGTDTRIGIISYAKTAVVAMDSYNNALFSLSRPANVAFLKAYIDKLQPKSEFIEGTSTPMRNIGDGMRRAYYVLDNSPDINSSKFVVVFADGAANVRTIDDPFTNNPFIIDGDAQYVAVDLPPPAPLLGTAGGYASYVGGMMRSNYQKIYFVSMSGAVPQLEDISVASGSTIASTPKHYYINALPETILTVTNSAATSIYNDVQYFEYADDLQFSMASFNEIFPAGVTVVSVAAPYDYFTITKIDSGPDKGRYQVSANINGLVLHKVSQNSDGLGTYKLMAQKISINENGVTSITLEPVEKISIKVKYSAKAGTVKKVSSKLFYSEVNFNDNKIDYIDYFGNDGSIGAIDYQQRIYFSPDVM